MKISIKSLVAALLLAGFTQAHAADNLTPKTEFRSSWLATVWALDWPSSRGTGDAIVAAQKAQMEKILDSLAVNNFNAVNFQVRGMSDAMYKSKYEPWSQYLTNTRGGDPGYDPLAFVIEECHKRGMECHAWVNPYRFSSTTDNSGAGDATGYYEKGWLIEGGSGYILNPSLEEVQDHVVAICRDIVENYDIDGMLFDDYYYNGAALSQDATQYSAYTSAGGTLSQADWRRSNVHSLMSKLYKMFQETKPWIRFGQAPQGVTARSSSLAAKYGVDVCPSGYDNNYNSQYIDILGWLQDGIIDYISPQVYWAIDYSSSDYGKIVPWWSEVVDKFNRHLFVSQSISGVTSSSRVVPDEVTSSHTVNYGQVEAQVALNRESTVNGAFGSVFYSARYLYRTSSTQKITLAHDLKRYLYSMPSLPPAMTWKDKKNPGTVSNLDFDGISVLSWTGMSTDKDKRYSVYAIPNGLDPENFDHEVKYLLGFTYDTQYEITEEYRTGYYYAVCVYDRYGYEWDPAFIVLNYDETLPAVTLISPENGFTTDDVFSFSWEPVSDALKYALDISESADFTKISNTWVGTETSVSSNEFFSNIPKNVTAYWRVRSIAAKKNDGVSETRTLVYVQPELTYPVNEAEGLDPKVNFTWVAGDGMNVLLEVATDKNFTDVVMSVESTEKSYQTPVCALHPLTIYYARVVYNGKASSTVQFTTKSMPCEKPTFKFPVDGGVCYPDSYIEINPQDGAEFATLHVDLSSSFGSSKCQKKLSDFDLRVAASDILLSRKNPMVDGTTYYARAQVSYYDDTNTLNATDWSDVISFIYSDLSGVNSVISNGDIVKVTVNKVYVNNDIELPVSVSAISMLGVETPLFAQTASNVQVSLDSLSKGFYIIKVCVGNETRTFKLIK